MYSVCRHLKQRTLLHFVSADSADITYDLHFQLKVLGGSWWLFVVLFGSSQFSMINGGSLCFWWVFFWFLVVLGGSSLFLVVLGGSCWFFGGSWWFLVVLSGSW